MKHSIFFLSFLAMTSFAVHAQQSFQAKDNVINLSLGFGNALYHGTGYSNNFLPLAVSYERGVKDDLIDENGHLGVGGYLGYVGSKYRYNYDGYHWGFNYSSIIIGPRASFHYQFTPKLDTYLGVTLAYNIVTAKEVGEPFGGPNYSASSSGFVFAGFLGGRYYFTERLAGLLELGFGVSNINLGVALKVP